MKLGKLKGEGQKIGEVCKEKRKSLVLLDVKSNLTGINSKRTPLPLILMRMD